MRVRDCRMCFNQPNLFLSLAKTHFMQYQHLPAAPGANNGSGWENNYDYFIEFLQYLELFAYDPMKACSLRRYFDGLTVLHIAYR